MSVKFNGDNGLTYNTGRRDSNASQDLVSNFNMLRNGDFRVSQNENAPGSRIPAQSVAANGSTNVVVADGWRWVVSSPVAASCGSVIGNLDYPIVIAFSKTGTAPVGPNNVLAFRQTIEANDTHGLGFGTSLAKPVAISFKFRSDVSGKYYICLAANINGGRQYVTPITVIGDFQWREYKLVVPGDVTGTWGQGTDVGIVFHLVLAAGTNLQTTVINQWQDVTPLDYAGTDQVDFFNSPGTAQVAEVKLEEGSIHTRFESMPIALELLKAQRYRQVGSFKFAQGTGTTTNIALQIHNRMRTNPSATPVSLVNRAILGGTIVEVSNATTVVWQVSGAIAQGGYLLNAEFN